MPPYVGFTPTVPVTAPGWRIEPPVSVPSASGASYAATAAALPPPEPPGMRSRSHGLWVLPYAECSVDDPMANSSMLVLPRIGRPAALMRSTRVASYGGTQPSRIFEPAVVGRPCVTTTSLTAIGTPASGCSSSPAARRASTSAAVASASAAETCRYACTAGSTAAIRSRWACVTSTLVTSRAASLSASSAAERRVRSVISLLPEDLRDEELAVLGRGGAGQRLLLRQRLLGHVRAEHVGHRQRVAGGRHVGRGDLADPGDRLDDHVELAREAVELLGGQVDPRQARDARDLVTREGGHGRESSRDRVPAGSDPRGRDQRQDRVGVGVLGLLGGERALRLPGQLDDHEVRPVERPRQAAERAAEQLAELVLARQPHRVVLGDRVERPLGGAVEPEHGARRVRVRLDGHLADGEDLARQRRLAEREPVPGRRRPAQARGLQDLRALDRDHRASIVRHRAARAAGPRGGWGANPAAGRPAGAAAPRRGWVSAPSTRTAPRAGTPPRRTGRRRPGWRPPPGGTRAAPPGRRPRAARPGSAAARGRGAAPPAPPPGRTARSSRRRARRAARRASPRPRRWRSGTAPGTRTRRRARSPGRRPRPPPSRPASRPATRRPARRPRPPRRPAGLRRARAAGRRGRGPGRRWPRAPRSPGRSARRRARRAHPSRPGRPTAGPPRRTRPRPGRASPPGPRASPGAARCWPGA